MIANNWRNRCMRNNSQRWEAALEVLWFPQQA